MLLTWVRGKALLKHLALICLATGVSASAGAQKPSVTQIPAPRTIILPPKIVAGARATLAVLDSSGRLLPNVVVDISGGQKVTTDATGRALFEAPGGAGKLTAKIPGHLIAASSTVAVPVDSAGAPSINGSVEAMRVDSYPRVLSIHDQFTIEGTGFRDAADSNRVFLADQLCLVLASSPASLVVLPGPHTPLGAISMHVNVGGIDTGQIPVSAVLLEFDSPAAMPLAGTLGKLILTAHGTTAPLEVEVRNGSPGIIQFPHGNVQRVMTSGGEQNIASVELKFLSSGDYTVTAKLISTNAGSR